MFTGNFAPKGWAQCDGQLLPISQNTALFSLLGTTFGGDGRSTFALPNLQGSAPLGPGQGSGLSLRNLGEAGGEPAITLLQIELPGHSHTLTASTNAGDHIGPQNALPARAAALRGEKMYSSQKNTNLGSTAAELTGGGQPHNNLQPFLTVTFIIALQGIFPARS